MTCFHVTSGDPAPSRATELPAPEGTEVAHLDGSPWVTRRRKLLVCAPPRGPGVQLEGVPRRQHGVKALPTAHIPAPATREK